MRAVNYTAAVSPPRRARLRLLAFVMLVLAIAVLTSPPAFAQDVAIPEPTPLRFKVIVEARKAAADALAAEGYFSARVEARIDMTSASKRSCVCRSSPV